METRDFRMWIYPLKGARGVEVEEAFATQRGFEGDRRWMLIDGSGRFLSQREMPALTQCLVESKADGFGVRFGDNTCLLPLVKEGEKVLVSVWEDTFEALWAGKEASEFFSDMLGQPVRLVYMDRQVLRKRPLRIAPGTMEVSFADGYPYLILGTSSLSDLEARLGQPMEVERFRPNILLRTSVPYEEDGYGDLRLGEAAFRMVKPCARCQVVTLNPATGEKGKEPLRTLSKYRKGEQGVIFGMNAIALEEGWVRK
jgi:uncharacterized protein